jgi:leader peptidase (prepilin peptidase)/N-methyltransferase
MVVLGVYGGLLGLILGSFLNVVVYRLAAGLALSRPPSACPVCGHPIRRRHNVPVLGWLVLRGRCADCGAPISVRYPLVELATGAIFAVLVVRLDSLDLLPAVPAYLVFAAVGIVVALIELDGGSPPTRIVVGGLVVVVTLLAVASAWQGDGASLLRAAIGGAACTAVGATIAGARPGSLRPGDAGLAGLAVVATAYVSCETLVVGAVAAGVLAAAAGLMVRARHGHRSAAATPRMHSLLAGCLVAGALLAVVARSPWG